MLKIGPSTFLEDEDETSCQALRASPAPTEPLKASSDVAVTAETGREFYQPSTN